jgi:hypothetical protein
MTNQETCECGHSLSEKIVIQRNGNESYCSVKDIRSAVNKLKANSVKKEISFDWTGRKWIKISEEEIDEIFGEDLI